MTAQDILIVELETLKIKSPCNALISMMKRDFLQLRG